MCASQHFAAMCLVFATGVAVEEPAHFVATPEDAQVVSATPDSDAEMSASASPGTRTGRRLPDRGGTIRCSGWCGASMRRTRSGLVGQVTPGDSIVRVSQSVSCSSRRSRFSLRRSFRLFWAFFFGFSLLMMIS